MRVKSSAFAPGRVPFPAARVGRPQLAQPVLTAATQRTWAAGPAPAENRERPEAVAGRLVPVTTGADR